MWWHAEWGWGAWLAMSLGMVAFWGTVLWVFLNVVRASQGGPALRQRTPEEILAERLARGEIDEDDYRRRLGTLHGSPAVGASSKAGT